MIKFDTAIAFVLKYEGGYVHDPDDPGGETKYGISKRQYPDLDIAGLTEDQAKDIYRLDYWTRNLCNQLPGPVAMAVFDTAVNMGSHRAGILLQEAANNLFKGGDRPLLVVDGDIGPKTVTTVAKSAGVGRIPLYLVHDMMLRRIEHYVNLNRAKYLKGWINRVVELVKAIEEAA